MALLLDLLVSGQTRLNDDTYAKNIYADKFIRTGSSDLYVLLGGGGHKLLSDFSMAHNHPYLSLAGGTLTGTLTLPDINITSTASSLPSHYYHYLYGDTVYEHFGNGADSYKITYGHFRFFNGNGSYKTLVIGGDGTFIWNGNTVLTTANYNTYSPTLTGTGASGTWGISISGNAATATNVDWGGVTNKPSSFNPSTHTHTKSQITDFPTSLPANGGNADTLDNIDSTGFLRNYSQNYGDAISNAIDISQTLTAGVSRVHISNIEYSSVLTGYDFDNKAWQLRFRPSYNDGIYFRSQGTGTTWKKLAFTSDIPTKVSQLTNDNGYLTSNSLNNYVTLNTAQTITGIKTFASNTFILAGIEYNDIKHASQRFYNWGGYGSANTTPNATGMYNSLDFYWYSTIWSIGNLRGGGTGTMGFGIGLKKQDNNGNLYFAPAFRITETASYINNNKIWHAGNLTKVSQLTNDVGYVTTDTTYSTATSDTLGLVKIGYAANGKNYPVQLNNGQMYVNVPWTDTNTDTNTWRPITDSYSGTSSETSLSQKGGKDIYDALVNGYASSAGNADTVDNKHASDFATAGHTHYIGTTSVRTYSSSQTLTGIDKFLFQNDGSLVIYTTDGGQDCGDEHVNIQTCFDNRDPQTHEYVNDYTHRCNLILQPRGGQVVIGKNMNGVGNTTEYKLRIGGSTQIESSSPLLSFYDTDAGSFASTTARINFNNSYATVGYIEQVGETLRISSTGGSSSVILNTGSYDRVFVNNIGDVGIGVVNPQYQLHVNYSICSNTGFVKSDSSNNYVLLGGGGHKAISDFATASSLNNYVTLATTQTITGAKTFKSNKWILSGPEYDNILNKGDYIQLWKYDDSARLPNSGGGSSITNSISFNWYDDEWRIGQVRNGSADTKGFAIALMNAADTHALDMFRIDANGKGYITGHEIFHTGNDGSGSGLDADLLDGYHASAFAAAGHTHSYLPLSGGTCTGNIYAPAFYESSDERLKDFYNSIDVDLDKLSSLPKKFFKWKSNPNVEFEIGTSAQELQKIYPQLVNTDDKGYLTVAYDKLSIIALRAIDKLYEMNKNLERRIQILESKH